jgi:UDP-N-acetylglucosamine 1-carboxyvinyltransferase
MQNRFQYIDDLNQMGASIKPIKIEVDNPSDFYNFNWQDKKDTDIHAVEIIGPANFVGGNFRVHDLRAGATILLAAISGTGTTVLENVGLIDRGYENIDKKLSSLGARIARKKG